MPIFAYTDNISLHKKLFGKLLYRIALPTSDVYGFFPEFSLREIYIARQCYAQKMSRGGGGQKLTEPFGQTQAQDPQEH